MKRTIKQLPLLLTVLVFVVGGFLLFGRERGGGDTAPVVAETAPTTSEPVRTPQAPPAEAAALFALTNWDRSANGLPALVWEPSLAESAKQKCEDIAAKDYWSHDPPGPAGPWETFPDGFHGLGENLARNFADDAEVQAAWMSSPAHRGNILGNYNFIGLARCENLVVAHFALLWLTK